MFRVVSRAAKLNGLNKETRIILAFDCAARILTGLIMNKKVFIGTDSGATTTKLCAVWDNGEPVSNKVLQRSTNSENGRGAVIASWIAGVSDFLAQNNLEWSQVAGVGLARMGTHT